MNRSKEVVRLAQSGMTPKLIADQTGLTRGTVYAYISAARRRGAKIKRFASGGIAATDGIRVAVPKDVTIILSAAARERQITTAALANRLLREIAQSDLVDAVLDDAQWLETELSGGGEQL